MSLGRRRGNEPRPGYGAAKEHVADPPATAGAELSAPRGREQARQHRISHARRFRWATALLFLLAIASLALAVALSGTSTRNAGQGAAWSAWRPPDDGLAGAQEIADYIAPY